MVKKKSSFLSCFFKHQSLFLVLTILFAVALMNIMLYLGLTEQISVVATVLLSLAILLLFFSSFYLIARRANENYGNHGLSSGAIVLKRETRKEKRWKIFAKSYIYILLLLMYLPILVLIIFSFTDTVQVGNWNGFSFNLYVKLFQNKDLMQAVWNTLLIAVTSAIVSTILGTLGAVGTFYSSKKARKWIETMNQLPVVNAEIVIALSLAVLAVSLSLSFSFFTLLIGHVVLTIAFVYLNVKPKLQQMDPFAYEAALDLGAKPRYALYKVVLPEIIPGILSGFMISFTLSLDDFVITQYLKKPSFETISTYIQKMIAKHPIPAEVRALTTIIFLVVLVVVVGNTVYNNRRAKMTIKRR